MKGSVVDTIKRSKLALARNWLVLESELLFSKDHTENIGYHVRVMYSGVGHPTTSSIPRAQVNGDTMWCVFLVIFQFLS